MDGDLPWYNIMGVILFLVFIGAVIEICGVCTEDGEMILTGFMCQAAAILGMIFA